jgi:hypothetical protein
MLLSNPGGLFASTSHALALLFLRKAHNRSLTHKLRLYKKKPLDVVVAVVAVDVHVKLQLLPFPTCHLLLFIRSSLETKKLSRFLHVFCRVVAVEVVEVAEANLKLLLFVTFCFLMMNLTV